KDNEDFLKYRANILYKGIEYFQLYCFQLSKSWFISSNLNRKAIVTINRLRNEIEIITNFFNECKIYISFFF
ncbi:hypothetical protein ALC53_08883, partial [Atta colombica]